jgi:cobaltochelatase CobN
MMIDRIAYAMATLDGVDAVDQRRRDAAKHVAESIIKGRHSVQTALENVIGARNLAFAADWERRRRQPSDDDLIRGLIGLGSAQNGNRPDVQQTRQPAEVEKVRDLVIRVASDPKKRAFIERLTSEQQFKQATGLLDPATLERAKTVARAIPRMAEAIEIGQQPDVSELLKLMQRDELRKKTFEFLDDAEIAAKAAEEQQRSQAAARQACTAPDKQRVLQEVRAGSVRRGTLDTLNARLSALKFLDANHELCGGVVNVSKDDLERAIGSVSRSVAGLEEEAADKARSIIAAKAAIEGIPAARVAIADSGKAELNGIVNALRAGFIPPSSGGDPVVNPASVPTGRNLYSIDAEKTPSEEAWKVGKQLADALLQQHLKTHGSYPKKIAVTLWPSDFIETEGALIGEVFYLLGVEPVRDPFGRVLDLRIIPDEELGRPRVDVVVQTAGQLRDIAASRLYLINKAVRMIAALDGGTYENFVRQGTLDAEEGLKEKGLSPKEARELSTQRVFGGVNGAYGTQIMGLVEGGDQWEKDEEVARTYLNNMSEMYDEGAGWGRYTEGAFEVMLRNTEAVIQPRNSNTWGPLSLDHIYEFMGGVNLAIRYVTGKEPDAYFNDFRNPSNARLQEAKEAIAVEARTTLLNPAYVREFMKGGASSAEKFAETFRNIYGWDVMKPEAIDERLWDGLHEMYVKDSLNLGVKDWFQRENAPALEEMTAVMLETVRKGYWSASDQQVREIAELHTGLIRSFKPGCSEFVCNNGKLREFIAGRLGSEAAAAYSSAIAAVRSPDGAADRNILLEKEQPVTENQSPEKPDLRTTNRALTLVRSRGAWITLAGFAAAIGVLAWKRRRSP